MYTTELMRQEHDNILLFLNTLRSICCQVLEGKEVPIADLRRAIAFARNYADKQHHGKEEDFLFQEMVEEIGPLADKLINHGMLVEHDLCRKHIMDLESALDLYEQDPKTIYKLDILESAEGYATLLNRHIAKENELVYPLAERSLSADTFSQIDAQVSVFEADRRNRQIQETYLPILHRLAEQYGQVEDAHDLSRKKISLSQAFHPSTEK